LFGEKFLQPIHASVPKLLVFQNPPRHISQRLWGQLKGVVTTVMGPSDKSNLLEHSYVLAKRGQGHRKWRSNVGYACRPTRELLNDRPTGRIRNGRCHTIYVAWLPKLNHMVQYCRWQMPLSIALVQNQDFCFEEINILNQWLPASADRI